MLKFLLGLASTLLACTVFILIFFVFDNMHDVYIAFPIVSYRLVAPMSIMCVYMYILIVVMSQIVRFLVWSIGFIMLKMDNKAVRVKSNK